jgi:hypothetical protein
VDFNGNGTGQWLAGPITIAADVVNATSDLQYALIAGNLELVQETRAFRLLPAELLAAAGLPVVSGGPRSIDVRYEVRKRGNAIASAGTRLVFGPSDGLILEPLAPVAPPVAAQGEDVLVQYDLGNLRLVDAPTIFVSGIGHWSPAAAPLFHPDSEIQLSGLSGTVRFPASAFRGGAGLYGIGIRPQTSSFEVGQVAIIRITPRANPGRPEAPLLADRSGAFGHFAAATRAAPGFTVRWNASAFGDGAALEVSAPAPTLRNGWNTFSNANGSGRDADGVDSPSTVFLTLPSAAGEKTFDAVQLGIAPGFVYNLRVLALRQGKAVGEASPSSALQLDDIAMPAGVVTSFELAGESSVASTAVGDVFGNLASSSMVRWSPLQAALGATVASDGTGSTVYEVLGRDASRNVALAARWPWTGSVQTIETWDAVRWQKLHSVDVDAFTEDFLLTARVDPLHHRAVFLGFDPTNFGVALSPFDLAGGSFGPPVTPALAPDDFSFYNSMTLDPGGKAYITAAAVTDFCLFRSGPITSVDMDTGATSSGAIDSCTTGLVADGKRVHVVHGPILSNGVLLPVARLQDVIEPSLSSVNTVLLGARSPLFPAVDAENQILVVGFLGGNDYEMNSNATSALASFDLRSGKRLSYSPAFNFAQVSLGGVLDPLTLRAIQLDPKTRTGWTIGAGSQQLQRFSY